MSGHSLLVAGLENFYLFAPRGQNCRIGFTGALVIAQRLADTVFGTANMRLFQKGAAQKRLNVKNLLHEIAGRFQIILVACANGTQVERFQPFGLSCMGLGILCLTRLLHIGQLGRQNSGSGGKIPRFHQFLNLCSAHINPLFDLEIARKANANG